MNVTDMISAARAQIRNLTVDELATELEKPDIVLVDVRESDEVAADGVIPGAITAPRGMLEFTPTRPAPTTSTNCDPTDRSSSTASPGAGPPSQPPRSPPWATARSPTSMGA